MRSARSSLERPSRSSRSAGHARAARARAGTGRWLQAVDGAAEVGPTPRHVSGGMFSYSPTAPRLGGATSTPRWRRIRRPSILACAVLRRAARRPRRGRDTMGPFRADRGLQQSVASVSPAAPRRLGRSPRLHLPSPRRPPCPFARRRPPRRRRRRLSVAGACAWRGGVGGMGSARARAARGSRPSLCVCRAARALHPPLLPSPAPTARRCWAARACRTPRA